MSYKPAPGSVAWKALQYLETLPKGSEVMTSRLAEAIGAEGYAIQPCMLAPIAAGLAFRRQKDQHPRSPWWYSLTDHSAIPRAPLQRMVVPDGAPSAASGGDIELHLVVRVTHAQAEAIARMLQS